MKYAFLSVTTTTEFSDIVANLLTEAGSAGVSIKDRSDLLDLISSGKNWDYIDESAYSADERVIVTGFFDESENLRAIAESVSALKGNPYFETGSLEISIGIEDSAAWENVWKQYYRPIPFNRVTIVPVWLKVVSDTAIGVPHNFGSIPVYLDPGLAFGTGMHETTAMCVEFIEELALSGDLPYKNIADVGCGSGILGICALSLGAKRSTFIDIDGIAIRAAKENVAHNGISDAAEFITGDFSAAASLHPDVVFANLTADLLTCFYKTAAHILPKNGIMVVSGVLEEYAADVEKIYAESFAILKTKSRNGWRAMLLTKNG